MFLLGPTSIVVEFQNALMQFETLILISLEFANRVTHGFSWMLQMVWKFKFAE